MINDNNNNNNNTNSKQIFGDRNINTAKKLEDLERAIDKLNQRSLAL
jgi:hypothetical protein